MGTLGNKPAAGFQSIEKQSITGNGGTSYALDHAVTNANDLEVFVNNVRQEPTTAYTISGQNIVMSEAIANTDSFYVIYQSRAFTKAVPADTSVTAAMLNADVQTSNDARYVNTTGDTMTGNLTVGGIISATGTSTNTNTEADIGLYHSFKNLSSDINTGVGISMGSNNSTSAIIYAQRTGGSNEHKMGFQTRNSAGSALTRMAIDGSGNVTKPNNPWFDVRGTGNSWTSAAGLENILNIFNTSLYQNTGGGFNSSNSTYTAPVAGRYCFLLNSYTKGGSTGAAGSYVYPRLYKNGSSFHPRSNILHYNSNENYDTGMENTILVDLAANDTIQAGFYSNNTSNQYYGAAWHLQMFFVG